MRRQRRLAFSGITEAVQTLDGKVVVTAGATWSPHLRAAVSEIVQTRDGEIRVKMRSKAKQDAANVRLAAAWSDRVAAQQFYDYADEHFDWAETAKTDRERSIFLQMAAAWLDIAEQWEKPASKHEGGHSRLNGAGARWG